MCISDTYSHDEWSENHPAGLPPQTRPVSNHFLNVVIELVGTYKRSTETNDTGPIKPIISLKREGVIEGGLAPMGECETQTGLTVKPRDGDALKEDQEEQAHPAGGVVVKELEDIQAALQEESKQKEWQQPLGWDHVKVRSTSGLVWIVWSTDSLSTEGGATVRPCVLSQTGPAATIRGTAASSRRRHDGNPVWRRGGTAQGHRVVKQAGPRPPVMLSFFSPHGGRCLASLSADFWPSPRFAAHHFRPTARFFPPSPVVVL